MGKKSIQRKLIKKTSPLIGEYLKDKREDLGIELRLISQKTRINYKILEKLESNRFDELPNKTYIRGFCQIYAKELNLDVEEVMSILNSSYNSQTEEDQEEPEKVPTHESHHFDFRSLIEGFKERNSHLSSIIMAISSLLVVVIFFFAVKILFTDKQQNQVLIAKNESAKPAKKVVATTQAPIAMNTATPTPTATAEPVVTATPTPSVTPTPVATVAKKKEQNTTKDKKITFRPMALELYSVVRNAPERTDEEIFPKRYRSIVKGKQNIFIHAISGDTWLIYKKDGFPIRKFTLKQGRMVMIRGEEVLLFLGNVNVTKIFLNGQLLDTPSSSGVKSMVFPEELASEYHIPLFPRDKNGVAFTSKEFRSNQEVE